MPWAAHEPSGLLAGFFLALGLYNLLAFFVWKQPASIVYAVVATVAAAFELDASESSLFAWMSVAATACFAIVFLDLREFDIVPEWILIGMSLAAAAFPLLSRFQPEQPTLQAFAWDLLWVTQVAIFVAGIRAMRRDYPGARFFVVGSVGATITAFSGMLFGYGLAWQAVWFTAALTDRMRALQEDEETDVDVAPSHASRIQLQVLAESDALTGVPNRRSFDEHLEAEWSRALHAGTAMGLIMVDVDRFKDYNDRFGHVEGDVCLSRIAKACSGALKRHGDFFARYGGEEFAAIVATRSDADLAVVAERMRQAVSDDAMLHPTNANGIVTISLGTARLRPSPANTPTDLITAADEALYDAKASGRNCVRPMSFAKA